MEEAISTNPTSRTGERGFTLLEVIVSLTILSISLAVLLGIFSQGLMREHASDRAFAARALAQSLIARASTAQSADFGETTGHTAAGLSWRLLISPYGKQDAAQAVRAASISASVEWQGEGKGQSLSLATLRLMPGKGS